MIEVIGHWMFVLCSRGCILHRRWVGILSMRPWIGWLRTRGWIDRYTQDTWVSLVISHLMYLLHCDVFSCFPVVMRCMRVVASMQDLIQRWNGWRRQRKWICWDGIYDNTSPQKLLWGLVVSFRLTEDGGVGYSLTKIGGLQGFLGKYAAFGRLVP